MVRNEEELTSQRLIDINHSADNNLLDLLKELYPSIKWLHLKREPLYSFFEHLVFGLFPKDTESHLRFFLDEVMNFNFSEGNDMLAFVDHWLGKRGKLSIALTENREAIRILTVHKSKGLEFPVVIHPNADYANTSSKNQIWTYIDDEELKPLDRLRINASSKLTDTPFEADYLEESALTEMDMYNMLYVALTRPRNRLYVCGKLKAENVKDKTPSSAIQFMYEQVATNDGFNSEDLSFSNGDRTEYSDSKPIETKYLGLKHTGDPFWMQRISISQPSRKQWKTTSDDARDYGILVHDAMAHIKTHQDIGKAIQILTEDGRVAENEIADLEAHISNLLKHDLLKQLFDTDKRVLNEADIQLENGKWLRPDRVVTKGDRAWVIDYKTGGENPKYKAQVEEYKDALRQLGFSQVDGMLVYVDEEHVVSV